MKTAQGRNFLTTTIIFLVALLVLGMALQILTHSYLTETVYERLDNHSRLLSELISDFYDDDGSMDVMQYYINLSLTAQASETSALVFNAQGQIHFHSERQGNTDYTKVVLKQSYRERIAAAGCLHEIRYLKNIYSERRYISARCVYADNSDEVIAYVLTSAPVSDITGALRSISDMFMLGAIGVMIVSMIVMAFVAKRQSYPLREMAQKARAFGHGDLDVRVRIVGSESQEVEELAIAFNNMASSLQKSEYSRQEFVANVSHELKTPMTTIGGYVDGILDGTIPPEKADYYLQIVSTETKRLSRLVRSMLDISQLQSEGGIPSDRMTRFDVEECAGQMLITFEQKITDKNIQVDVDMPECPIYTVAQQDYISQVIYNLLDNAVKFCPQGGRLSLKIRESGNKIYVSVGNDGNTIPSEELPLLFDRFHKMDKSRAENRDGWGLGLYIVKTIIGLHGEDISATSADNFTEFTFTLPLMS